MQFRVGTELGYFWGLLEFQKFFLGGGGCLKFLMFF